MGKEEAGETVREGGGEAWPPPSLFFHSLFRTGAALAAPFLCFSNNERGQHLLPPCLFISFRTGAALAAPVSFHFFSNGGSTCCPRVFSFHFERGQRVLPPFLFISFQTGAALAAPVSFLFVFNGGAA